jgi:hypothetical protein
MNVVTLSPVRSFAQSSSVAVLHHDGFFRMPELILEFLMESGFWPRLWIES